MSDDAKRRSETALPSQHEDGAGRLAGIGLEPESQDVIARKLREAYAAKLGEEVPDKFRQLLDHLASKKGG